MKKKLIYLVLFLYFFSCKNEDMPPIIPTEIFANGNSLIYQFGNLSGHLASLAFDKSGNLYVADNGNDLILKIDTTGKVSRFAGSGLYGHADGSAKEARFLGPTGLVFDKQDNLYVSETNFVRQVAPDGTVTTIAGSLLDENNPIVRYKDGLSLLSKFSDINSIAIDSENNLYVADSYNSVIRKISQDRKLVTTIAGNGIRGYHDGNSNQAEFSYPLGIAFNNNIIYVADSDNYSIREILNNSVSTLSGNATFGFNDGFINNASFEKPTNLVFDKDGSLYISDAGNHAIRKISSNGKVTTLNIKSTSSEPFEPYGVAIYKSSLYVTNRDEILKINLEK